MSDEFTKRELEHFFKDIRDDIKDIKDQVTKTNGRVTALEKWRWFIMGGIVVLAFIVGNSMLNV